MEIRFFTRHAHHSSRITRRSVMKIVIAGGSGLIGKKLTQRLRDAGHQPLPASPSTGVNCLTGEGVAAALAGADVVVDVVNAPAWEDDAVMNFFQTSTRNILRFAGEAGVRHLVALSVVGADRMPDSGYMRAKVAQEALIRSGDIPYTIVRATQFFEFVGGIAQSGVTADGSAVRLPHAMMQPIAADDVAAALAEVAQQPPRNGMVEVAGPDAIPMDELVRRFLTNTADARPVIADDKATYFGTPVDDRSLTPGGAQPLLGPTHFDGWLSQSQTARA
jgi:uncharacterized protein YbjT (DUF2867 family)